jgi:Domain of unknown function (DUF4357)
MHAGKTRRMHGRDHTWIIESALVPDLALGSPRTAPVGSREARRCHGLVPGANCFVLTQNHTFSSASAAASVLLGRNANGRQEWTDADGLMLKEIQNAGREPESAAKLLESRLRRIERKVKRVERFDVVIVYHGDDKLPTYSFERASSGDMTVAQWRDQRFARLYPDCEVKVLLESGEEAHGVMKLTTVRETYAR